MQHIAWRGNCDHLYANIEGVRYIAEYRDRWTVYRESPRQVVRSGKIVFHYESHVPGMIRFVSCNTFRAGRCTHCYLRQLMQKPAAELQEALAAE